MQLLLSAHPDGLVVSEIQDELEIPNSTLSHHREKLKGEDLVRVQRESMFLRYTASTDALQELLQFLYAESCTRNKAVNPEQMAQIQLRQSSRITAAERGQHCLFGNLTWLKRGMDRPRCA